MVGVKRLNLSFRFAENSQDLELMALYRTSLVVKHFHLQHIKHRAIVYDHYYDEANDKANDVFC